jgi:hypothetical protein
VAVVGLSMVSPRSRFFPKRWPHMSLHAKRCTATFWCDAFRRYAVSAPEVEYNSVLLPLPVKEPIPFNGDSVAWRPMHGAGACDSLLSASAQ